MMLQVSRDIKRDRSALPPRQLSQSGKGLLAGFILLGLIGIVGELSVRWLWPEYGRLYNAKGITGRQRVHYNSRGFRDLERPTSKSKGVFRILAFGDSITWGYQLKMEETWTKRFEDIWNRREISRIEVWNMSGYGRAPAAYLNHLDEVMSLEPDLFIVQLTMNDVGNSLSLHENKSRSEITQETILTGSRPHNRLVELIRNKVSFVRVFFRRSYFLTMLDVQLTKFFYRTGLITLDPNSSRHITEMMAFGFVTQAERAWKYLLDDLRTIRRYAQEHDIPLVLMPFPYRYQLGKDPNDHFWGLNPEEFHIEPISRLRLFSEQEKFFFLDITEAFQSTRDAMLANRRDYDPLYFPLDYTHPNAAGQKVAAEFTYRKLKDWKLLEYKQSGKTIKNR